MRLNGIEIRPIIVAEKTDTQRQGSYWEIGSQQLLIGPFVVKRIELYHPGMIP